MQISNGLNLLFTLLFELVSLNSFFFSHVVLFCKTLLARSICILFLGLFTLLCKFLLSFMQSDWFKCDR